MAELDDWVKTLYNDEMTKIYVLTYRHTRMEQHPDPCKKWEELKAYGSEFQKHFVSPLDALKWAEKQQEENGIQWSGIGEVELH